MPKVVVAEVLQTHQLSLQRQLHHPQVCGLSLYMRSKLFTPALSQSRIDQQNCNTIGIVSINVSFLCRVLHTICSRLLASS